MMNVRGRVGGGAVLSKSLYLARNRNARIIICTVLLDNDKATTLSEAQVAGIRTHS